jgi:pimeloyl-ACP methyl ester carboxylesterase
VSTRRILTTAIGLGAIAHGLAARKARRIQAGHDPVPYDQLCAPIEGEARTIERSDGTRIHARVAGEGPTVVLVHGFGVTMQEWNLVWTRLLARGCRCVAFDLRGHGASTIGGAGVGSGPMAGDYEAVLRELEVEDAILVGHSTGGFLAIRAMLDHPSLVERLRGFVAVASTAGEVMRGSPQNRLQLPLMQLGLSRALARSPTYGWLFGASVCGDAPSPAVIRAFNEVFADQRHAELTPLLRVLTRESYYDRLHEIVVPSVIVCGERDHTTPRWHSEQLGVRIPEARNVWIPGKGHLLNWEAPDEVVAAIASLQPEPESP